MRDYDPERQGVVTKCLCWNGMTEAQQERLSHDGILDWDDYGGGGCHNMAEVAIDDPMPDSRRPGPRFYCRECATKILTGVT